MDDSENTGKLVWGDPTVVYRCLGEARVLDALVIHLTGRLISTVLPHSYNATPPLTVAIRNSGRNPSNHPDARYTERLILTHLGRYQR